MGEVTLRRGGPADFEAAVAVYRRSNAVRRGGAPAPPEHEERIRTSLRKPDAFVIVADDGGAIVGMTLAMQGLAEDGAGPPIPGLCFVGMVYVLPTRWGEGIGSRLVEAVCAEARARGYDRAQLWTHADNLRAQRLYDRHGFRRAGREKDNDLGERIFLYERSLPAR